MNEPRCIAQLLRNESPRAIDFNITHGKGRIVGEVDGDDPAVFRPIQKYINGTWYNVAQV